MPLVLLLKGVVLLAVDGVAALSRPARRRRSPHALTRSLEAV